MWLLGSSMYSAHLAAAKGLPYVFAHHFSGQGTAEALPGLSLGSQPSDLVPEPVTFLTVNAFGRRDRAGGGRADAAQPADDGKAADRSAPLPRLISSRTPRRWELPSQVEAMEITTCGLGAGRGRTARSRPQNRSRSWRSRSASRGHGQSRGLGSAWHRSAYGTGSRADAGAARQGAPLELDVHDVQPDAALRRVVERPGNRAHDGEAVAL